MYYDTIMYRLAVHKKGALLRLIKRYLHKILQRGAVTTRSIFS